MSELYGLPSPPVLEDYLQIIIEGAKISLSYENNLASVVDKLGLSTTALTQAISKTKGGN